MLLRQEYFLAKSEKNWNDFSITFSVKNSFKYFVHSTNALYIFETSLRCNKKFFELATEKSINQMNIYSNCSELSSENTIKINFGYQENIYLPSIYFPELNI